MKTLSTEPYWKQAGIPLNLNHLEVLYQTNEKCKSDWYRFSQLIMKNNMKLEPSNVDNFICVVGKKSPKVTRGNMLDPSAIFCQINDNQKLIFSTL